MDYGPVICDHRYPERACTPRHDAVMSKTFWFSWEAKCWIYEKSYNEWHGVLPCPWCRGRLAMPPNIEQGDGWEG